MAKLTNNERSPYTDVIVLNAADIVAIGNGGQKVIASIPAGGGVELCAVIKTVAITGSTSLVMDVGTTLADPDEFIDNLDVDGMTTNLATFNTGDSMYQGATTTTILAGSRPAKLVSTKTDIVVEFNDAAIADITAGQVIIGLSIIDLNQYVS